MLVPHDHGCGQGLQHSLASVTKHMAASLTLASQDPKLSPCTMWLIFTAFHTQHVPLLSHGSRLPSMQRLRSRPGILHQPVAEFHSHYIGLPVSTSLSAIPSKRPSLAASQLQITALSLHYTALLSIFSVT